MCIALFEKIKLHQNIEKKRGETKQSFHDRQVKNQKQQYQPPKNREQVQINKIQ